MAHLYLKQTRLPGQWSLPPVDELSMEHSEDKICSHSRNKLQAVAGWLSSTVPSDRATVLACTTTEATSYRCRCGFQIIRDDSGDLAYAVRENQQPVAISEFAPANKRIREAMKSLLHCLHKGTCSSLSKNLTSVTFSTSWHDGMDGDCLLTMHYDVAVRDETMWRQAALLMCDCLNLRQLTGRSKKRVVRAKDEADVCLRDRLLTRRSMGNSLEWEVIVLGPADAAAQFDDAKIVRYAKAEDAFFHPNAHAMKLALEWMLVRTSVVAAEMPARKLALLELYCGCGAHTVALAKSDLLDRIVAVELDKRLVEACRRNIALNNVESVVSVESSDASDYAQRKSSGEFDMLLVDPPKQGLDDKVCQFAINAGIEHFLYISCGHEALQRDLGRLGAVFDVVDCKLTDLFPGTSSVETLVHLKRRR